MRKRKTIEPVPQMPALYHWPDQSDRFTIEQSEVVQWLIAQPEVLQWLFNTMRQRKLIVFDAESGTWHGRDT